MGEEIVRLPIHDKVYGKLKEKNVERMCVSDLYEFIERMHVCNGDSIQRKVCSLLLSQGLTPRQVENIRRSIAWKVKFSRSDSRQIIRDMAVLGLVERKHYYVYIK